MPTGPADLAAARRGGKPLWTSPTDESPAPSHGGQPLWTPPAAAEPDRRRARPARDAGAADTPGPSAPYGYPAARPPRRPRPPHPQPRRRTHPHRWARRRSRPPAGRLPGPAASGPVPAAAPVPAPAAATPVVGPAPPARGAAAPADGWGRPRRVDAVPGTPFGVVQLDVPPVISGLAIGAPGRRHRLDPGLVRGGLLRRDRRRRTAGAPGWPARSRCSPGCRGRRRGRSLGADRAPPDPARRGAPAAGDPRFTGRWRWR